MEADGTNQYFELKCPAGQALTGGGSKINNAAAMLKTVASGPTDDGTGWGVVVLNQDSADHDIVVRVVCIPIAK
ncbi:hypothetical protein [Streptomyces sp. NPDC058401]|uniref:hypothetical protein n=1 Tax=Streptomyces sp. NPDC058401 TaxID=3346480 RepID=UPI00364DEE03